MSLLYVLVAAAIAIVALSFILSSPRAGVTIGAVAVAGLFIAFQRDAGLPAAPDGRLSGEPWRVLAVSPLDGDRFLVSVRYDAGDIRTYRLHIADSGQRDAFLKAQQGLKKGKAMVGRAQHSRAGLADDGDMGFSFSDAPEAEPKAAEAKDNESAVDAPRQTAERE
jgi:hypothetical protein